MAVSLRDVDSSRSRDSSSSHSLNWRTVRQCPRLSYSAIALALTLPSSLHARQDDKEVTNPTGRDKRANPDIVMQIIDKARLHIQDEQTDQFNHPIRELAPTTVR